VLRTGIELKLNAEIGKDVTIEQLRSEGYRAIFLGLGAWEGTRLGVPGEDLKGVTQGLDFLVGRNRGESPPLGKRVAVIGGGDVAIDSARLAHRAGADVTVVYRRTRNEMPAIETEVEEAEAEGIKFVFLAAPERIEGDGECVQRLVCRRMELSSYHLDGRRRPVPTEEEYRIEVDTVIAAIGQRSVTQTIVEQTGITITGSGRIVTDPFSNETTVPLIYAGGDVVTGPSIVLAAIGAGERAAVAINQELSKELPEKERSVPFWRRTISNDTYFNPEAEPVDTARMIQDTLPLEKRANLDEVELAVGKGAGRTRS
jgi:NADPH-dependent glutamate synthase beta subunit-like oxidoreductase